MGKTLFDLTGHASTPNVADLLEERWHNEGVTKGIQHKAVLGLLRHVQSPEGMFTFMPTGMARQLKPTDPMVGEIIERLTGSTAISPKQFPKYIDYLKQSRDYLAGRMSPEEAQKYGSMLKDIPSKFHPKYKDAPQRHLQDILIQLNELRGSTGKIEQANYLHNQQLLRAMREYKRLGTTGSGTATKTGTTFQKLMDLTRIR
jgi:hypothetical protein